MKTDTPETDTHQEQMEVEDLDVECSETYHLARKLERERDEARAELDDWRNAAKGAENSHPDEQHCTCVHLLHKLLKESRTENKDMREVIREAHEALNWTLMVLPPPFNWQRFQDANAALAKLQPYLK